MSDPTPTKTALLSDSQFNAIKVLVAIILPAAATLYFALSGIWGLPYTEQVVGTIAVVTTFLGTLLGISARRYDRSEASSEGYLTSTGVNEDTGLPDLKMVLTKMPDEILANKTVRLKVVDPPPTLEEH